tara:strand:- start:4130 stop:4297 length:168 start_codon:yes stop_codon:yes gene_type:complete
MKERNNNWTHIVIAQYSHDNEFWGTKAECEAWIESVVGGRGPVAARAYFIIEKGQ